MKIMKTILLKYSIQCTVAAKCIWDTHEMKLNFFFHKIYCQRACCLHFYKYIDPYNMNNKLFNSLEVFKEDNYLFEKVTIDGNELYN